MLMIPWVNSGLLYKDLQGYMQNYVYSEKSQAAFSYPGS